MGIIGEIAENTKQETERLIDEVANAFKRHHRVGWEIAERVHTLNHKYGLTDQAIVERLAERGIKIARPTVNMYRLAYDYYVHRMGMDPTQLSIPITTLAQARPFFEDAHVGREKVHAVLKAISGLQQSDALRYIRNYFGVGTDKIAEFGTIKVPREVYDAFIAAHEHMNNAVQSAGDGKLTKSAFLDFLARLVLDSTVQDLRDLYRRELGGE